MSPTKLKERSSGSSAPRSTAKEDAIATAATNLPSSTGSQRQSTADPSAMVKTESTTGLHPWAPRLGGEEDGEESLCMLVRRPSPNLRLPQMSEHFTLALSVIDYFFCFFDVATLSSINLQV
ncbi:unnamed protein product [Linum tenue]|uniref:Uncharacterized protein n=1 Tax=Linum tenue TaxID=586396 RepID=A0AAV0NXY8_9ROSI|nr:unnamed protein product [Linum tenue]